MDANQAKNKSILFGKYLLWDEWYHNCHLLWEYWMGLAHFKRRFPPALDWRRWYDGKWTVPDAVHTAMRLSGVACRPELEVEDIDNPHVVRLEDVMAEPGVIEIDCIA